MEGGVDINAYGMTGDELLRALSALSNPHRLRIVGALAGGRNYVSELARVLGMSRPLLHMHLKKLESAGLVIGSLELSEDGKAMRYFEPVKFEIILTPDTIVKASQTLADLPDPEAPERK